jgi:hypothetical protein
MSLGPPPVYQANLLIVTQQLLRTDMSRPAEVTFALECTVADTLAEFQDAIDDFQANFNTNIVSQLDSEVQALPPTGKGGAGTITPFEVVAAGSIATGGNPGTFVPPNVAVLVKKITPFGGRINRGRTYYPFAASTANVSENGTIAAGSVATFQTQVNLFLNQLNTDNTPMVILNKIYNTPHPPRYVTNYNAGSTVTSYTVESIIATQRRRVRS